MIHIFQQYVERQRDNMGLKYGKGQYFGTRGSIAQTYFMASSKQNALTQVSLLPSEVRPSAKRFIKKASNAYDGFAVAKDTSGNTIMTKEKPGDVPGSRAIYFLVVNRDGEKITSYKETYDPSGNLVHRREK